MNEDRLRTEGNAGALLHAQGHKALGNELNVGKKLGVPGRNYTQGTYRRLCGGKIRFLIRSEGTGVESDNSRVTQTDSSSCFSSVNHGYPSTKTVGNCGA